MFSILLDVTSYIHGNIFDNRNSGGFLALVTTWPLLMYWALWKVPGLGKRIKLAKLCCPLFKLGALSSCATNMFVPFCSCTSKKPYWMLNITRNMPMVFGELLIGKRSDVQVATFLLIVWPSFISLATFSMTRSWEMLQQEFKFRQFVKRPKIIEKYNFFKRHDQALPELLL